MNPQNTLFRLFSFLMFLFLGAAPLNAIVVPSLAQIATLIVNDNPEAQTELGTRYIASSKHKKEISSAYSEEMLGLHWYLEAAGKNRFAKAQFLLANYYVQDAIKNYGETSIPSGNFRIPFMWLERAAHQEYADAQFTLGCWYEIGIGTPHDVKQATVWYVKYIQNYAPGRECPICTEPLQLEDQKDLTSDPQCKNVFHTECLNGWKASCIDKFATCPLCRKTLIN